MRSKNHLNIVTTSPEQTESLGVLIGKKLKGGEVIELVSDLGGGKTTFVRGLAHGFGSKDKVSSPTFTVSKVYVSGSKQIHHFDFYRLNSGGMVAHELAEYVSDPDIVIVVEWASVVHEVLPGDRITLNIQNKGQNRREMQFNYNENTAYLFEGVDV